jgi:hypothetical protein
MDAPLLSNGTKSAKDAAPSVKGQEPPIPAKIRNVIRLPEFGARAQAILKIKKMILQILYITALP